MNLLVHFFLFLNDAHDEVSYEIKEIVLIDMEEFIVRFSKNKYLITTRPYTDATRLSSFSIHTICELNQNPEIEYLFYKIANYLAIQS